MFLDEMGAATDMTPAYGWAPRGERLLGFAPHGHWKTSTLVMGLRCDRLIAPMVIPCPMNGAIFAQYTEEMLAKELNPGDLVVMDNLSSHKSDAVRNAIEAAGAELLFLPPYSPDLNPIEMSFAQMKSQVRRGKHRQVETLWRAIGRATDDISPAQAKNYFEHIGYRSDVL